MRVVVVAAVAALVVGAAAPNAVAARARRGRPQKWRPTVTLVRATTEGIGVGQSGVAEAQCPGGYSVMGGSFIVGGGSLFAHATSALPVRDANLYRASVSNPPVNPFAGVGPQDASITAAAICAVDGRPVVVDGAFGEPETLVGDDRDPRTGLLNGNLPSTVYAKVAGASGIENGDVRKIDSECTTGGSSVFGGGFALDGSVWGHTSTAAVLSRANAYSATLVTPPSNPSLGVLRASATLNVTALCARDGRPLVFNDGPMAAAAARRGARARRQRRQRRMRGTVVLAQRRTEGIASGSVETISARCPAGYSVFGGSYVIGGNSVLTHPTAAAIASRANAYTVTVVNPPTNINAGIPRTTATLLVAAQCARRATPIVIDGPFG